MRLSAIPLVGVLASLLVASGLNILQSHVHQLHVSRSDAFEEFDNWLTAHQELAGHHGEEFASLLQLAESEESRSSAPVHIVEHFDRGIQLAAARREALLDLIQTDLKTAYAKMESSSANSQSADVPTQHASSTKGTSGENDGGSNNPTTSVTVGSEAVGSPHPLQDKKVPRDIYSLVEKRTDAFAPHYSYSVAEEKVSEGTSGGDSESGDDPGDDGSINEDGSSGDEDSSTMTRYDAMKEAHTDDWLPSVWLNWVTGVFSKMKSAAEKYAKESIEKYNVSGGASASESEGEEGGLRAKTILTQTIAMGGFLQFEDGSSCHVQHTGNAVEVSTNNMSVHGFAIPLGDETLCLLDPSPFQSLSCPGPNGGALAMYGSAIVELDDIDVLNTIEKSLGELYRAATTPDIGFPIKKERVVSKDISDKVRAILEAPLPGRHEVSSDASVALHRLETHVEKDKDGMGDDWDKTHTMEGAKSNTKGKRKILVGMMYFKQEGSFDKGSVASDYDNMEKKTQSMLEWFQKTSFGNLELELTFIPGTTQITGKDGKYDTINVSKYGLTSKGLNQIILRSRRAAKKKDAKYDYTNYDFDLWIFGMEKDSKSQGRWWDLGGMANLRGRSCIVNHSAGGSFLPTAAHEFGHVLSLHHSKKWEGDDLKEYGDRHDVMGTVRSWTGKPQTHEGLPYFQVAHLHWLNWIPEGDVATIAGDDQEATFKIFNLFQDRADSSGSSSASAPGDDLAAKTHLPASADQSLVRTLRVHTADEAGYFYVQHQDNRDDCPVVIHRRNILNSGSQIVSCLTKDSGHNIFVDVRGAVKIEVKNIGTTDEGIKFAEVEAERVIPTVTLKITEVDVTKGLRIKKAGEKLDWECKAVLEHGASRKETTAFPIATTKTDKVLKNTGVNLKVQTKLEGGAGAKIQLWCRRPHKDYFFVGEEETRSNLIHAEKELKTATVEAKDGKKKKKATIKYQLYTTGVAK